MGQTAPIRDAMYFLLESAFADLPVDARILCVGVGTGAELAHLAGKFPGWRFTAVEPSGAMLDECRKRAEAEGSASRCRFHEGYVETLPLGDGHDAATGVPPEGLEGMRQAYAKDVAVPPPKAVAGIIESGGFGTPVQFYQAGMIHAWLSRRGPANYA